MRKRLGNPGKKQLSNMISMRIRGSTYAEIAAVVGLTKQAAWLQLTKAEVKEEINKHQTQYIQANLERSLQGLTDLIHSDPNALDNVDRRLQYEAWSDVAEIAGIKPTPAPSIFIQSLNQVNLFQTPMVKEIIGKYTQGLLSWDKKGEKNGESKNIE